MVFYYCLVSCGPNKFECKNNHWWKQCLEDKHRCDGLSQCADQSDETGCRKLYNLILLHECNDSKTQWWKWNEPIRFKGEKMWRLHGNKRRIRNVAIWLVLPIFFCCLSACHYSIDEINANRERGERSPCEMEISQSWHFLSFTLLIQIPKSMNLKRTYGVYFLGCNLQGEYITPVGKTTSIRECPRELSAAVSHRPSN